MGAGDFFQGLFEGLLPEVKTAVETRVKESQDERKRQKDFSNTINELFLKGQIQLGREKELETFKEAQPSRQALTKQRERGRGITGTGLEKAFGILSQKPTGAVKEGTQGFLGFGGQKQFSPEQQLLRRATFDLLGGGQGGMPEFDTPEDAQAAGLPIGSIVIIGGELVEID